MSQIKGKTIQSVEPINGHGGRGGLLDGCILKFTDGTHVRLDILPEGEGPLNCNCVISISRIYGKVMPQ